MENIIGARWSLLCASLLPGLGYIIISWYYLLVIVSAFIITTH
jgi:hypothetical protein